MRRTGLAFFFVLCHRFLFGQVLTSERVFYAAGNLVSEKLTRLSYDFIQANMTLSSWRRAGLTKQTLVMGSISALIHLTLFDIRQMLDIRKSILRTSKY